jgi:hypothetical protein
MDQDTLERSQQTRQTSTVSLPRPPIPGLLRDAIALLGAMTSSSSREEQSEPVWRRPHTGDEEAPASSSDHVADGLGARGLVEHSPFADVSWGTINDPLLPPGDMTPCASRYDAKRIKLACACAVVVGWGGMHGSAWGRMGAAIQSQ